MTQPGLPEFPAAKDDDDDDVSWALQTAAVQWKRGSPADAVVWLRRAIDSAVSVAATWRAAELTRQTDALEAYLLSGPPQVAAPPEAAIVEVDDFDGTDMIDAEAMSLPPDDDMAEAARPLALSGDSTDEHTDVTPEREQPVEEEEVVEIDEDDIAIEADEEPAPDSVDALLAGGDEPAPDSLPRFPSEAPSNQFPSEAPTASYVDRGIQSLLGESGEAEPDTVSEPEPAYRQPDPLPYEVEEDPAPTPVRLSVADAEEEGVDEVEPVVEDEPELDTSPESQPPAHDSLPPEPEPEPEPEPGPEPGPAFTDEEPDTSREPEPAPPPEPSEPFVAGISLAEIRGFEDFPPETQVAMAQAARVERLATEEEVSGFGLALVLRGAVNVMPAIADVACGTAGERELIYGRGTLADGVALRLVATAPDTQIAIWDFETIEPPLNECPWVLEELQAVADKYQALAGVSMGPMGDRLDDMLRGMVLERCKLVKLLPGEVLVEKGKPVGGLYIVGAGRIELGDGNGAAGEELQPGDFLFAPQVLSAGAAPTTARAAASGALLMAADRHAAHELMVIVPPLLELLAG